MSVSAGRGGGDRSRRLGGVSCNLRQLTGPICARRPPDLLSPSHTRQGQLRAGLWRQRAAGRRRQRWGRARAGGVEFCDCGLCCPRVCGLSDPRGMARLLAFLCLGGAPGSPARSAGGLWGGGLEVGQSTRLWHCRAVALPGCPVDLGDPACSQTSGAATAAAVLFLTTVDPRGFGPGRGPLPCSAPGGVWPAPHCAAS